MDNTDILYFESNGEYYKAEWSDSEGYYDPRDPVHGFKPTGHLILHKNDYISGSAPGDETIDDWYDWFRKELREDIRPLHLEGEISASIPSFDELMSNSLVRKQFLAGSEETGYHFDKEFFEQTIDSILDSIFQENEGDLVSLSGGFICDKDGKLTDDFRIDFKTAEFEIADKERLDQIKDILWDAVSENLNEYGLRCHLYLEEKNTLSDLDIHELYQKWAENKIVKGVTIRDHSQQNCYASDADDNFSKVHHRDWDETPAGFDYIDKNSKPFQELLETHTEAEAVQIAEGWLIAEIELLSCALEGNVHDFDISVFDKSTLQWILHEDEGLSDIYGKSLIEVLPEQGYPVDKELSDFEVIALEVNYNLPEFKNAAAEEYFSLIKENLALSGNNVGKAAKIAMKLWQERGNAGHTDLKIKAWSEYLSDNEIFENNFVEFLEEKCGIEKSLPPMSFTSEKLEAVYSVVRNENSSLNKAVKNALLIDYDNKRFSFVSGVGYMLSKPSDTYLSSVEKLSSGKAVEKRVGQLVKLGFKNVPLESGALEEYRWDDAKIRKYILQEPDRSR